MTRNQACRWTIVILPAAILLGIAQPDDTVVEPEGDTVEQLTAELERIRAELAAATEQLDAAKVAVKSEQQRAVAYRRMFQTAIRTLSSEKKKKQRDASARELLDKVAAKYKKRQRRMDEQVQVQLQSGIALLYNQIEVHDEAIAFGNLVVAARTAALGEAHRDTLVSRGWLASFLEASGDLDEAILLQRETLVLSDAALGAEHYTTVQTLTVLCDYLTQGRRFDEAVPKLGRLGAHLLAKNSSSGRKSAAFYLARRAEGLQVLGRYAEAEQQLRELVGIHLREYGPDHQNTFDGQCRLAWVLGIRGRTEESERLDVELAELAEFMEDVYRPFWTPTYAGYLEFLGRDERAEKCLVGILERNKRFGYAGMKLNEHIQPLVDFHEARGNQDEAARYRAMLARPETSPTGAE